MALMLPFHTQKFVVVVSQRSLEDTVLISILQDKYPTALYVVLQFIILTPEC